jgi:CspA family cold shock protein
MVAAVWRGLNDPKKAKRNGQAIRGVNVRSAAAQVRRGGALRGGSFPMGMSGVVKFFNGERGYGFIKPDDGGRDVFVHITAVERAGLKDLTEGQRITFEVEPDKKGKGPKAVDLVITG